MWTTLQYSDVFYANSSWYQPPLLLEVWTKYPVFMQHWKIWGHCNRVITYFTKPLYWPLTFYSPPLPWAFFVLIWIWRNFFLLPVLMRLITLHTWLWHFNELYKRSIMGPPPTQLVLTKRDFPNRSIKLLVDNDICTTWSSLPISLDKCKY